MQKIKESVFFILMLSVFVGCSDNTIVVNTQNKTISRPSKSEIKSIAITGEEGSIFFTSDMGSKTFSLIGENTNYAFKKSGNICCDSNDKFIFKPIVGKNYTIQHSSNGDSPPYIIEVVFRKDGGLDIIDNNN